MAEAIVSFVIEKLGDSLIQETVFLYWVSEKVLQMQSELKRMKCFLKDADPKLQEGDERVRNWVEEIRDAAYDAEDVIDKFILKVASKRRVGIHGVLRRYACIINEAIDLHVVGKEIEAIQSRIHNISLSREVYGIKNVGEDEGTSSTNERQRQLRRSYPHVEDEDMIGLEKDIETLAEELINEEGCHVVSVVGMGGLGKTTLAKKVYKHNAVQYHFDCYSWTFISQQCRVRDVLLEIIKEIGTLMTNQELEMIGKMKEEELVVKLYNFLKEKRYLVVLDDIWTIETWDSLKSAFPRKMGSKVMLTTRNKEIAEHVDARGFLHEPRCLTEEQSLELLCKKAFLDSAITNCPTGLVSIGREIVRQCGGLPLAVAVLGGLLASKASPIEWENVCADIKSYLNKGEFGVKGILALSYIDLPCELKTCFLYLGLFPEDFEIPAKKLIRLWVAEGFV